MESNKKDNLIMFIYMILFNLFVIIVVLILVMHINFEIKEIKNNFVELDCQDSSLVTSGSASWYSWEHCLGCNAERRMANGEILDDNKNTCAYNYAELGEKLILRYNERESWCIITDRMGNYHDIDLTPKVFQELGGNLADGIIKVEIELIN